MEILLQSETFCRFALFVKNWVKYFWDCSDNAKSVQVVKRNATKLRQVHLVHLTRSQRAVHQNEWSYSAAWVLVSSESEAVKYLYLHHYFQPNTWIPNFEPETRWDATYCNLLAWEEKVFAREQFCQLPCDIQFNNFPNKIPPVKANKVTSKKDCCVAPFDKKQQTRSKNILFGAYLSTHSTCIETRNMRCESPAGYRG